MDAPVGSDWLVVLLVVLSSLSGLIATGTFVWFVAHQIASKSGKPANKSQGSTESNID